MVRTGLRKNEIGTGPELLSDKIVHMNTISVLTAKGKLTVGETSFLFCKTDFHIAERLFRITQDFHHIAFRKVQTVILCAFLVQR